MEPGGIVGGRFEIERPLGSGGSATVYRARDRDTGTIVAVKILPRPDVHRAERFAREAAVLAELEHPAIVRYVAHGATEDGDRFLAMEWVDAAALSAHLADTGVTLREAVALVGRIAGALAEAHDRGVVHRDIKPANILLPDGRPSDAKLIDFGVARDAERPGLTMTGAMLGTPAYMAPEQAEGRRDIGPAADVFSLGCVLYECATGMRAFGGEHLLAIRAKVLLSEPPPLRSGCPEAPPALQELVCAMLAKAPDRRLANGAAVRDALRALPAVPPGGPRRARRAVEQRTTVADRPAAAAVVLAAIVRPRGVRDTTDPLRAAAAATAAAVAEHGGVLQLLADRSAAVCLLAAGATPALAARAARCALAVRRIVPEAVVAVAMAGDAMLGAIDTAIDRGADAIAPEALRRIFARWAPGSGDAAAAIRVDEQAARLLQTGFRVIRDRAGHWYLDG